MRLTRMEVKGFKSFADRTDFDFDADLTGIVGPNGCGKSNVVDALKWVLGDQRAKSLRGAEMTDVIFKGAEGRDGAFACEVTISLQSQGPADDEALGGRSEVRIGRRLTRDKESTYLLNGEPVRLKDVRNLLMDTGLGVGAYSVMEQGRIDAVLSANPEQRRAIFEEAAGISRFRLQKRETLRKLERAEQNLARAKDLLEERSRRIRGLKVQAGKARRYRELQTRLRSLWSSVAVVEGSELRARQAIVRDELQEAESSLVSAESRIASIREELARWDQQISEAEEGMDRAVQTLREASTERDAARHRADALEEKAEQAAGQESQCAERRRPLEASQTERRDELQAAREKLENLEAELIEVGRETEAHRESVRDAQTRVRDLQARREAERDSVLHWVHERTSIRNRLHDHSGILRAGAVRRVRIGDRITECEAGHQESTETRAAATTALQRLDRRSDSFQARETKARTELEEADRVAADLGSTESSLRERLASARSRLELLQGLESGLEGIDLGPRTLLERKPPGLRGRLLDVLEVDLEHGRALEAALGPYVQALVVDTRAQAESMLELLREEDKGRAMILVSEEFGDRLLRPPLFALPEDAEFLYSKVRCQREAWPMVQWLLRGVCLIESVDDAKPERPDLCFVTNDGRVICGPRIEGGSEAQKGGGLVVRRAQIQALSEEMSGLETEVETIRLERQTAAGRVKELGDRVARLGEARAATSERRRRLQGDLQRAEEMLERFQSEIDDLRAEIDTIERETRTARSRCIDDSINELCASRLERDHKAVELEVQSDLESARSIAESSVQKDQELRVRHARVKSDRDGLTERLRALEASLRELDQALEDLGGRESSAKETVASARAEAEDLRAKSAEFESSVGQAEDARANAADALDEARSGRSKRAEELSDLEEQRERASTTLNEARMAAAEAAHKFQRIEDRLREDAEIELRRLLGEVGPGCLLPDPLVGPPAPAEGPVAEALVVLQGPVVPPSVVAAERDLERLWKDEEFDLSESKKEAHTLKAQRDRLGSVNLSAVEELASEEDRLGTVEQDVQDLEESRKSLMEALRRMELESRSLFQKTFELARENFRTIFRKLFQGGRADMYLESTEDALESGIEIVAKPPGKELQSIALLSGGERSLTALAILFAVFQVKPSPFCILDEVDAALDETNVERFLRVLGDYVGPSQFCIVTHHKRTMAACQVLYGITMQKRGVSSRMSVALAQVEDFNREPSFEKAVKQRIAGEEQVGF
ncbi:MAG: chromosome segregation protein SMC [Planctomycetota bacterium]